MGADRITSYTNFLARKKEDPFAKGELVLNRETDRRLQISPYSLPPEVEAGLSREERELLNELTRACRRIADLYQVQVSNNFWPQDITSVEINEASKENPEIKSPYTYVRKDENGNLYTIPYHEAFADLIREKELVESLEGAARLAGRGRNKDVALQTYLRSRAAAFKTGNWVHSESIWLQIGEESKIMIVIGPYDTYNDERFGIKFSWESWVGVKDEIETEAARELVRNILQAQKQESGQEVPRVGVRVDNVVMTSGQAADQEWSGNSLPCQVQLRQEHGSVLTIFKSEFDDNLKKKRIPTYRAIISPDKRRGVTKEMIREANRNVYIGHEVGHSFAPDAAGRLKGTSTWVKELYCDLFALKTLFSMAKTFRECEVALSAVIVSGYLDYRKYTDETKREDYYKASTILLNYLLKRGAVQIKEGFITWKNQQKMIDTVNEMFNLVDALQRNGSRGDAHDLFRAFLTSEPQVFKRLRSAPVLLKA